MRHEINYYKIFGYSLIPFDIILFILLELDFFKILPAYWNSIYVFYIFLVANTAFLAMRLGRMSEYEREGDYTVFYSKYLFLLGLIVLAINQFLKRDIILQYQNYIIGIVIALGFLTFFASKDRVEKEIEDEKESEERAEKRRKEEFDWKFPRIAKLNFNYGFESATRKRSFPLFLLASFLCPFVFIARLPYKLIKWMYKEGWVYSFSLFFILIVNIFLVMSQWYLIKGLWIDEWISIESAKVFTGGNFPYFLSGNPLSSGYIYFFLLSCIDLLLNGYFHSGRLLNILFYLPFIFIFYYLSKKYTRSKTISIFSVYLISSSLFLLNMQNEIRGYVFSLILIYLIFFVLVYLKKNLIKIPLVLILAVILVDNHITNIYFVFIGYLLVMLYILINKKRNYYPLFYSILAFPILGLLAYKGNPIRALDFFISLLSGNGTPNWATYKETFWYPFEYLLDNVTNRLFGILGIFGAFFVLLFNKLKEGRERVLYLFLFVILFLIPLCLSGVPEGFRYFFVLTPIWVLIISIGVYHFIWLFSSKVSRRILSLLFLFLILAISFGNINEVPWAKTLDFRWAADKLNYTDSVFITNSQGLPIEQYGVHIDYILYDAQDFRADENLNTFGRKNLLGFRFEGKPGYNYFLDSKYINLEEIQSLVSSTHKRIILFIRPWPADITDDTIKKIESMGFSRQNLGQFQVFILDNE